MIKLMMFDDEPLMLESLQSIVDWEAYHIEICATGRNGKQAMDLIAQNPPHLVITDINMPAVNGLELLEKCREKYGDTPLFIMLTCVDEYQLIRRAFLNQAVDYLVKLELTADILTQSITKAIQRLYELDVIKPDKRTHIVEEIKEYINQNLHKRLDLSQIAEEFGYTSKYISLIFKKYTDSSFVGYVNVQKINEAKRLFLKTNAKVYEVSDQLGFESPFYFSKVFKKYTGLSPREFAKKNN